MIRRVLGVLAVATLLVGLATPALAKSYVIDLADVEVRVEADGSLLVTEHLTFDFDGEFQGAYRDIPLRAGEAISDVEVSEGGQAFAPGAPTALGSSGNPGSFGVEVRGSVIRIVWHYRAIDEFRTFSIRYRMTGVAVAHDDVVDVNLQVWGGEWSVTAREVTARLTYPGTALPGEVLVFGHPASVNGKTSLGDDGVSPSLEALDIPTRTFVEMRVVFPRSLLDSVSGAQVVVGPGLENILAEELAEAELADSQSTANTVTILGLLGLLGLVAFTLGFGYLRYGRERRVEYDREYEQAPPSSHDPAMVNALLSQGSADERAFTAVMFDLIRRGHLKAHPVNIERKTWLGLKSELISDLEISRGDTNDPLSPAEGKVLSIMHRVLDDGPVPLSEFRTEIRADADSNHSDYVLFRSLVKDQLEAAGLLETRGRWFPLFVFGGLVVLVLIGWAIVAPLASMLFLGGNRELIRTGFIILGVIGGILSIGVASATKLWVRLSREGALLAARWMAFQEYLSDFSRLEEAPPIAIGIWEEYLVYGITLGVAEDVLEAARLAAPAVLEESSSLYWYGNQGFTGGHSSNAISGIESALSGAFAPPSSSGGGGGFSGGGGGGGGGGGAW